MFNNILSQKIESFKIVMFILIDACPNGWLTHGISCYHFSHDLENWADAMVSLSYLF